MKEQLEKALIKLQRSANPNDLVTLKFFSKDKSKQITAQLHYQKTGQSAVDIIDNKGYNTKYISTKLRSNLRSVLASSLAYAGPGDKILIRSLTSPPAPGTKVPLSGSTYYYSVNNGLISCNGQQLGSGFQAIYVGPYQAKCDGGSAVMDYSELNLI